MKRFYVLLLWIVSIWMMSNIRIDAQNIQLHYDFGRHIYDGQPERPQLTSTVEMFKSDKWGNTFFFVDMDYTKAGVKSAYWEIVRELKFWEAPLLVHLEYNGGLSNKFSFASAFLAGGTYAYNAADYSYGFAITPMYKYLKHRNNPHSAQLTMTWYLHFAKGLLTFNGFMDAWIDRGASAKSFTVFLSEPQLWFNFNKLEGVSPDFKLSVGGELELSYNFVGDKCYAMPTLGAKWTF